MLARRATCRNFAADSALDQATFAHILHRVFGAQACYTIYADNVVIKRTSPSGGGLHPTEAYLLVQNVVGIAPGLYHYHPVDHALEPMPTPAGDLRALARRVVADQEYYVDAPVFVVLVSRFARTFWKYRNHSKAYRVAILDAGHLSQTLYLSATEFGLGAFITAAMNEVDVEQAFGLDPLQESPLAVCGFGHRAAVCETFEFDPNRKVWPQGVAAPQ
jgi:putative peptide maturation dehydrogenase